MNASTHCLESGNTVTFGQRDTVYREGMHKKGGKKKKGGDIREEEDVAAKKTNNLGRRMRSFGLAIGAA